MRKAPEGLSHQAMYLTGPPSIFLWRSVVAAAPAVQRDRSAKGLSGAAKHTDNPVFLVGPALRRRDRLFPGRRLVRSPEAHPLRRPEQPFRGERERPPVLRPAGRAAGRAAASGAAD